MTCPYLTEAELIENLREAKVFTPLVAKALKQAKSSHGAQKRALRTPYLEEHIYPVVQSLVDSCGSLEPPEILIAAAFLHDVLEDDQAYSSSDMKRDFGEEIASIVAPLTKTFAENRKTLSQSEKRALNERVIKGLWFAPEYSKLIKLADRLNNVICVFGLKETEPERFKRVISETEDLYLPFAKDVSLYFYELLKQALEYGGFARDGGSY